jgi:putative redox protein
MTANIRHHQLFADEPIEMGGQDSGPSPFELLAAGLAACTATTLRMYSARKGWDFGEITVSVHYFRKEEGRAHWFARSVGVSEPLDEHQQQRLLAISNACPVHKTLADGIEIITKIQE